MLATLDQVNAVLGLTAAQATAEQAKNVILLASADAAIKAQCGQDFELTTYPRAVAGGFGDSGYYYGEGSRFLFLRQTPVVTITSIYQDAASYAGQGADPFPATTLLTATTDYFLHLDGCLPGTTTKCSYKGVVERVGSVWSGVSVNYSHELTNTPGRGQGNIKIAYTAGYPTIPADLNSACLQLVAWLRQTALLGGLLESERFEDYAYTRAKAQAGIVQIGSIRSLIWRYKRRMVA